MKLQRYENPSDFYKAVEAFLLENEAANNLALGVTRGLMNASEVSNPPPYLATIQHDERIIASIIRTPPAKIILSALPDIDEMIPLIVDELYKVFKLLPGVLGPKAESLAFAEAWYAFSRQPYALNRAERIYQLENVIPVTGVGGSLRRARGSDRKLLVKWIVAFHDETSETGIVRAKRIIDSSLKFEGRGLYIWEDEKPVSLVGFAGPTPNGIRIGPVYTPPEHRRRGYASAGTAALSQMLLDEGRKYCFLFTDLDNPTSNHIYQEIGYTPVCDIDEYKFLPLRDSPLV